MSIIITCQLCLNKVVWTKNKDYDRTKRRARREKGKWMANMRKILNS